MHEINKTPYFPFFALIEGKEALIAGGGTVALRKIEKLQPYKPKLTVIAPDICGEIRKYTDIKLVEDVFTPDMLDGKLFAIAATDDETVNDAVAKACGQKEIPVNVVDDRDKSTFIFPALLAQGGISLGVSSGGDSPLAAIYLRNRIRELIPENYARIVSLLGKLRGEVKEISAHESERKVIFEALFEYCMTSRTLPEKAEMEELIQNLVREMAEL